MITDKGRYVLDCIRQGINVSLAEFDQMWAAANELTGVRRTACPNCNGSGFVLVKLEAGGEG